jgi:hypothetical protein
MRVRIAQKAQISHSAFAPSLQGQKLDNEDTDKEEDKLSIHAALDS